MLKNNYHNDLKKKMDDFADKHNSLCSLLNFPELFRKKFIQNNLY